MRSRLSLALVAAAVVAGALAPSANADCAVSTNDRCTGSCSVNLGGDCRGACPVNTGNCHRNGDCTVNTSYCKCDVAVNIDNCGKSRGVGS